MKRAHQGDLQTLMWPLSRLNEALEIVARRSGLLSDRMAGRFDGGSAPSDLEALARWLDIAAAQLGIEMEAAQVPYDQLEPLLHRVAPALVEIVSFGAPCFLAVIGSSRKDLRVLGPDLTEYHVSPDNIGALLCAGLEIPLLTDTERLLQLANVHPRRSARVRRTIVKQQLGATRVDGIWLLRTSPGAPFWRQVWRAGLLKPIGGVALAHTLQYLLWLASWWIIGRGALEGRLDRGWLLGWVLLLASMIPCEGLTTWFQGLFSIGLAGLLKQRLLHGALHLEPEEIRYQGAGQLMGRVLESEAVESLALTAGFVGLDASLELVVALVVLMLGAAGRVLGLLLFCWIALSIVLGRRYWHRRASWTEARLEITHDLIERMVGHRTRLAQQPPERWHQGEDESLERYTEMSRTMDRDGAFMTALVPRGWLLTGMVGLAPSFVSGSISTGELAVSLGGIVLAYQAFQKLAMSLSHIAGAIIAWKQAAPLFDAAARAERIGSSAFALSTSIVDPNTPIIAPPVIQARDLVFGYRGRGEFALQHVNLAVYKGDRILIQGPSGGGKSTLAALLAGLRIPEAGLILLNGLDHATLGSATWRRRIAAAPQFHENHVFTGTLGFNLLMGRRWPPTGSDLDEAEVVCRELGLGRLLDTMPAGLMQVIGETGWRLSHGECSRLYIARALLQQADVVILDESLGALDPETRTNALECVMKRVHTVIVIAHH